MPCRLFVKAPNLGNDNVILLPRILGWNMLERRGPPIATHLIPEGWLLFDVNFTPAFSLANPRPPSPLDEKSSSAPHALDRALGKKRKGATLRPSTWPDSLRPWRDHELRRACQSNLSRRGSAIGSRAGSGPRSIAAARCFSCQHRARLRLTERRVGGLVIVTDPFFNNRAAQLAALGLRHAMPTVYHMLEFVTAGGLAGYGNSYTDLWRQIGIYTGRMQATSDGGNCWPHSAARQQRGQSERAHSRRTVWSHLPASRSSARSMRPPINIFCLQQREGEVIE